MRAAALCAVFALATPLLFAGSDAVAADKKGAKKKAPVEEGVIVWKVAPDDVVVHLDGKKLGTAGGLKDLKVKAGQHLVRLIWGKDEAEEPFTVPANQKIEFQYTFEDSGAPK